MTGRKLLYVLPKWWQREDFVRHFGLGDSSRCHHARMHPIDFFNWTLHKPFVRLEIVIACRAAVI
jgi:hypothetical protein